jgi:membrane protein DedA with SNARE-associated domain
MMPRICASRIVLAGLIVVVSSIDATAAGRGGFLSAIVGRSAGYAAGAAMGAATGSNPGSATASTAPKVYDAEHLTAQQLEQCVIQAKALD